MKTQVEVGNGILDCVDQRFITSQTVPLWKTCVILVCGSQLNKRPQQNMTIDVNVFFHNR